MRYRLKKKFKKPCVHVKNHIVIKVNNEFINFTGYSKNELIGKTINEISYMLRINSEKYINNKYRCCIFNKKYELKEVIIFSKILESEDEKIYFFKEVWSIDIEEKLNFIEQLHADTKRGIAIIRVPDLMLLKTNDKFLDFIEKPLKKIKNSSGIILNEIFDDYQCNILEKLLKDVIYKGKPYYKRDFEFNYYDRKTFYWDLSIIPIYVEGKIKYIIQTILDIKENVLYRKNVENQNKIIKEQKEELETIIENMSDGLFVIDKDYKFSLLNSSARDFIYNPDYMKKVGDTLIHTKYYNSKGKLLKYEELPIIRVLKGENIKDFILTCDRPNGIGHFSVSGSPIYDKNGNLQKTINCFRDITEQINNHEVIKTQKEQLEIIIENMLDCLIIFYNNGKFIKLNKLARDILPFENDILENIQYEFEKFECYDEYGNIIEKENSVIERVIKGEEISKYKMYVKINNKFIGIELNANPIYNSKGKFIAGILMARDITDKIKSEETLLLETQLNLLNSIIGNLDIGFVRYSYPEFKIVDINNKSYNDLKYINSEAGILTSLKGKNYCDIFKIDETIRNNDIIINLMEKKKGSFSSYRKVIIEGEEKFFKFIHQPLLGLNGSIIEMIVIAIDISSEVKSRNKMKEALKMQEEIFANISHELKTPLNVIFSTIQLMELYLKSNVIETNKTKFCKNIDIIKQNCYRFTKLINNIVDLSKIEAGFFKLNLSNENIVQVTEDIVQSISEYIKIKGLNIIFDTNTEEKIIACDPEKIERIILNLISNAIKFSNVGNEIFVNVVDKTDSVEIEVKDMGIGIEKKYLSNIFERFEQVDKSLSRNSEGSGIGLSLVKSIVEMHGGKIGVDSKVGEGSVFRIELPARIVEDDKIIHQNDFIDNKIENIHIEFSDIYSM